jgi:hypothetical protein
MVETVYTFYKFIGKIPDNSSGLIHCSPCWNCYIQLLFYGMTYLYNVNCELRSVVIQSLICMLCNFCWGGWNRLFLNRCVFMMTAALDQISCKLLKAGAPVLNKHLTILLNNTFKYTAAVLWNDLPVQCKLWTPIGCNPESDLYVM